MDPEPNMTRSRRMLSVASPILLAATLAAGQEHRPIAVSLERRLLPDPVREVAELQPVPGPLPEGLRAYSTTLPFRKDVGVRIAVLEREGAKPVWLIDKNLDGELSSDEQIDVVGDHPTVVEFPLQRESFPSFPIQVQAVELPPDYQADIARRNVRILYYSHAVDVTGKVNLDGQSYDFFYRVNSNTFDVALSEAWVAVDSDHDGKIDTERWTEEMAYALGKPVVLKAGKHYLRTDAVDTKTMTARMSEVDASEYRLISMRAGHILPDFSFVDLGGAPHSLQGDRGPRYTLLYFWASWCTICKSEIGIIDEADRTYRDRGFRVVGINGDKDPTAARKFLKEHGVDFLQARWDSVQDLVQRSYCIFEWPTAILLDAGLRVVSTNGKGELHIRKDGLMPTLEGLLGAKAVAAGSHQ